MTRASIADPAVLQAAQELINRLGRAAASEATERANRLAQQARWPEHDVALRVLTVIEQLLDGGAQ